MITKKVDEIKVRFRVELDHEKYKPVFNAAPGMQLPVITSENPTKVQFFYWGLIPFWAKSRDNSYKMINARGESLTQKPAYRSLLKSKRCLVIADGFFEWKKTEKQKNPYNIKLKDDSMFAFAGLCDSWKNENNETINSFTIITTSPNLLVSSIHDRMPVILPQHSEQNWLSKSISPDLALKMLLPYPEYEMKAYAISTLVNSSKNNFPEILSAIDND